MNIGLQRVCVYNKAFYYLFILVCSLFFAVTIENNSKANTYEPSEQARLHFEEWKEEKKI